MSRDWLESEMNADVDYEGWDGVVYQVVVPPEANMCEKHKRERANREIFLTPVEGNQPGTDWECEFWTPDGWKAVRASTKRGALFEMGRDISVWSCRPEDAEMIDKWLDRVRRAAFV